MAYQRILQLTYVEDLLVSLKTLFVKLFQPFLASFVASLHAASTTVTAVTTLNLASAFEGWDAVFDKLLKGLEEKASAVGFESYIAGACTDCWFRSAARAHDRL